MPLYIFNLIKKTSSIFSKKSIRITNFQFFKLPWLINRQIISKPQQPVYLQLKILCFHNVITIFIKNAIVFITSDFTACLYCWTIKPCLLYLPPRYMSFETCCLLRSYCSQFDQHANKYFLSLAEFNFKMLPMENSIFSLSCFFWPSMYRRLFNTVTSQCRNLRKIYNLYTTVPCRFRPNQIHSLLSVLDHRLVQLPHLTHVHFLQFNVDPLNVAVLNQLPNLKSVAMEMCVMESRFILMPIYFCSQYFLVEFSILFYI